MELKYFRGNPAFSFEGKEGGVRSVWEMKLSKGETVAPHAHPNGMELYVVVDGIGEMKVGDDSNTILAGDVVYIPRNTAHSASNTTEQPLHVVGVLWEVEEQETGGAADTLQSSTIPGSIKASTAISHIGRLTTFAEAVRGKIREALGADSAESEQRIAEMEAAVMKSIGKIWADYSGSI